MGSREHVRIELELQSRSVADCINVGSGTQSIANGCRICCTDSFLAHTGTLYMPFGRSSPPLRIPAGGGFCSSFDAPQPFLHQWCLHGALHAQHCSHDLWRGRQHRGAPLTAFAQQPAPTPAVAPGDVQRRYSSLQLHGSNAPDSVRMAASGATRRRRRSTSSNIQGGKIQPHGCHTLA